MRRLAAACGIALAALAIASAPAGAIVVPGWLRTPRPLGLARSIRDSSPSRWHRARSRDRRTFGSCCRTGYTSHPHRRYGVLYLLHGTSGRAADWTTSGGAEQTTAGRPLIVVMPDIGLNGDGGGWCTNWVTRCARAVGDVPHRRARAVDRREPADGPGARGPRDRGAVAGRVLLDELRGPASRLVRGRAVVLGGGRHGL